MTTEGTTAANLMCAQLKNDICADYNRQSKSNNNKNK